MVASLHNNTQPTGGFLDVVAIPGCPGNQFVVLGVVEIDVLPQWSSHRTRAEPNSAAAPLLTGSFNTAAPLLVGGLRVPF